MSEQAQSTLAATALLGRPAGGGLSAFPPAFAGRPNSRACPGCCSAGALGETGGAPPSGGPPAFAGHD
eukprot:10106300-Lingulodinium_polyedra.AAC.1